MKRIEFFEKNDKLLADGTGYRMPAVKNEVNLNWWHMKYNQTGYFFKLKQWKTLRRVCVLRDMLYSTDNLKRNRGRGNNTAPTRKGTVKPWRL